MESKLGVLNCKEDFPIFKQKIYGKSLVYLDNAATTQKPECVLSKITEAYTSINANVHRSIHYLGQMATEQYESARSTIKRHINAKHEREIILMSGATEALNMLASVFGSAFVDRDSEIVVTEMEHHSNLLPWKIICEQTRAKLVVLPVTQAGEIRIKDLKNVLNPRVKLAALTYISNVTGTVNPVKQFVDFSHCMGIPVLVDASQAIPHIRIDVQQLGCDFLAFSGHKVYGPTGTGALYINERYLDVLPPYKTGGEMVERVSLQEVVYKSPPYRFEAGTPNYIGAIGLGEALNYLDRMGLGNIEAHESALAQYALAQLKLFNDLRITGSPAKRSGAISFNIEGCNNYDIGTLLDKHGIAVRAGVHCAEPFVCALGLQSTLRISFGMYNTKEDIDSFCTALERCIKLLRQ